MSNNPKENCRIIGIDIHPRCFAAAAMTLKNKKQLWVHSRVELKDLDSWLKNQKFDFECRKLMIDHIFTSYSNPKGNVCYSYCTSFAA